MNPSFGTPFEARQGPYKQPLVDIYFIGTELLNWELDAEGKPTVDKKANPLATGFPRPSALMVMAPL